MKNTFFLFAFLCLFSGQLFAQYPAVKILNDVYPSTLFLPNSSNELFRNKMVLVSSGGDTSVWFVDINGSAALMKMGASGGGGGGNTIYTADDALTGNRIVTGGDNYLYFNGVSEFSVLANDTIGMTAENEISINSVGSDITLNAGNNITQTAVGNIALTGMGEASTISINAGAATGVGVSGGNINIMSGESVTGQGGNISMTANDGSDGGGIGLLAGNATTTAGGGITIEAGIGIAGDGGLINITAGDSGGANGGDVTIRGGYSDVGTGGSIVLRPNFGDSSPGYVKVVDSESGFYAQFVTTALTANRSLSFLNSTGKVPVSNSGRATSQTAANTNVLTVTNAASDASFIISANVLVTTSSAEAFSVRCDYTDESNTARTLILNFSLLSGTIASPIAFANGAVPYEGLPLHIRAKASTTIKIYTTGTFTGATYNIEGTIQQIN